MKRNMLHTTNDRISPNRLQETCKQRTGQRVIKVKIAEFEKEREGFSADLRVDLQE